MKFLKNTIESVHRQHFAYSGVMIEDHRAEIPGTIVVAHANIRPADKGRVTENDPRLLRSGEETFPENVKSNRHIRALAGHAGFRDSAVQEAVRCDGDSGSGRAYDVPGRSRYPSAARASAGNPSDTHCVHTAHANSTARPRQTFCDTDRGCARGGDTDFASASTDAHADTPGVHGSATRLRIGDRVPV